MRDDACQAKWLTDEVLMVGETARRFFNQEFVPNIDRWREQGVIDRSLWKAAGDAGLLGCSLPEEVGGAGNKAFMAITLVEQGRAGDAAWGISVHDYVCHYILAFGTDDQKKRWLPRLISGEMVAAIALTEPDAGSDLKSIRTTAVDAGARYVVNGQKTFITNGQTADLICVAVKTDPAAGAKGVSLLMVETDAAPGFRRGRKLHKIGLHAADTSELFFDDMEVPKENLLGGREGEGFRQLMVQLGWERLSIALRCVGLGDYALRHTVQHVTARKAFGGTLFDLQNTQFTLAEAKTDLEAMRFFCFGAVDALLAGKLDPALAASAKLFATDRLNALVDQCLQLHGGYGFMDEYPIARLFGDARAAKIYGGSNEVMKMLVARSLVTD
ncbi:acyl-CoA dehydrogenase family protein [Sphingobium sp. V4]|uniref:acyl-CoA dehydrogenase family protein n=1 Tax=Sphingobium sp. V4 TaxID=3038927 RepID=UPI002557CD51|nr:acyl-CoA dehydrogenase family protein [Sphingobium sp. V4]WIW89455.1 acyl-CoA dehydrogenase family protein [Sphingobium sp. V4]